MYNSGGICDCSQISSLVRALYTALVDYSNDILSIKLIMSQVLQGLGLLMFGC